MYPYALYIRYGNTEKIYTVSVGGYQQGISSEAFKRMNTRVPHDLMEKVKTYAPYQHIYRVHYVLDECHEVGEISDPIPLYEFYKMIGYDKATKKFNGLTLRQHIKKEMKAAALAEAKAIYDAGGKLRNGKVIGLKDV